MNKKTVKDIDLKNKRVLMRVDFNVPMADGKVTDDKRIKAALPTIQYVLDQGASLDVDESSRATKRRLRPRIQPACCFGSISHAVNRPVQMAPDCVGPKLKQMAKDLKPGDVLMLENTRFHKGEEKERSRTCQTNGIAWRSVRQ
jgi:phosphoglycerate kinase